MLPLTDLRISGVNTPTYDTGPRDRDEAIVFVHGNPGPSDDWDRLAPRAAEFARVIAMDMPGYGRADRPPDFEYTVAGYGRHLGACLVELGITRAHLVLHDFGGAWGLAWAVEQPDALASVTLINTGILTGYRWHKYARIWQTPIVGELFQAAASAPLMQMALDRDNPRPMPRSFVDRVMRHADWGHKRAVLRLYRASRDVGRAFAPLRAGAKRLDVPVCVVWGDGDSYLPVEYAERQREHFPRAEVHVLHGLGHWPFIDDPDAVESVVLPFLRDQTALTRGGSSSMTGRTRS
jgi:pimeloyl-ACP methyl ester carboxylesterase